MDNKETQGASGQTEELKLDYTLESPQERTELVKRIIDNTPPEKLTNRYLEILSDYILFAKGKEERQQAKKERKILTDNRMTTVNFHETSFQNLASQLENGEDGVYNMVIENDKNIILMPKMTITPKDIEEIPGMKQLCEAIDVVEEQFKTATGKRKYALKKQLIEMRKDKYVLRGAYKKPIYCMNLTKSFAKSSMEEHLSINPETFEPESDALINFFDPKHISALLCNYSNLKESVWESLNSDARWLMEDLDELTDLALKDDYPLYYKLMVYKIDGRQNIEIQDLLYQEFGIRHSIEYISSLWRNKIPKLIAEKAKQEYLIYHYTFKEKGQWKKCSRCGEYKLAHHYFFSKNKTSRDGWYSICKCCRNKKK